MQIDDFLELVKNRRSARRFKPGPPIPDEQIRKVLDAARWAMSGANGQPWEFLVVTDPETIKKINDIALVSGEESYAFEQTRVEAYRHRAHVFGQPRRGGMEDAAAVILVLGDRRTLHATAARTWGIPAEGGHGAHYYKNIANATQILFLAIEAAGLAARWVSVQQSIEGSLKRLLDVPDIIDIHTMVPVGYRAVKPVPAYRRELDEIIHYGKYDRSRYRTSADIVKYLADLRARTSSAYKQGS